MNLTNPPKKTYSTEQYIAFIAGSLKKIAEKMDTLIIVLSDLQRSVADKNDDEKPLNF